MSKSKVAIAIMQIILLCILIAVVAQYTTGQYVLCDLAYIAFCAVFGYIIGTSLAWVYNKVSKLVKR